MSESRSILACALAIALFAAIAIARALGWLTGAELALYDRDLRAAAAPEIEAPPITLVLIREDDIRRFGHPLRDDLLRDLIRTLLAPQPRALAIDLYRDLPVPPAPSGDPAAESPAYRALGEVVTGDPRVVMIMKFPDPGSVATPPPRFLEGPAQVGFADLPLDADGRVRRGLLYLWGEEGPSLSISLQLAARYLAHEGLHPAEDPEDPENLMLGPVSLSPLRADHGPYVGVDDAGFQLLLDYRFGGRAFRSLTLSQVMDGEFEVEAVRDRIVMVGTAAQSVKDSFVTPMHGAGGAGAKGESSYGVEVHAHAVDQLIRFAGGVSRPLEVKGSAWVHASIALFALMGAGLGLFGRSLLLQVALLVLLSAGVLAGGRAAFAADTWIPVVPPLLALVGGAALAVAVLSVLERAERRQIAGLFSRFQGRAVADEIWRRRSEFMGDGYHPVSRTVTLTALMSDLEGYTSASEEMEPEALMSWISEYMRSMAEIVEEHGGVVNDYAGDGVMANFGFPMPSEDDAQISEDAVRAVHCALAMGEKMKELNASWKARGLHTGRCRVGICTGPAVVGCIGGEESLKYTSVGDTVNTAARLEGFDKERFTDESDETGDVAWRVLISEETYRRTRDAFEIRALGSHTLKGKHAPIAIYLVHAAQNRAQDRARNPVQPLS